MNFIAEQVDTPPECFFSEHEFALPHIKASGLQRTRFINAEKNAVMYILAIAPQLKQLDEITGLLFVASTALPFTASRYGGVGAEKILIQSLILSAEMETLRTEIMSLLAQALETYRMCDAATFWLPTET